MRRAEIGRPAHPVPAVTLRGKSQVFSLVSAAVKMRVTFGLRESYFPLALEVVRQSRGFFANNHYDFTVGVVYESWV